MRISALFILIFWYNYARVNVTGAWLSWSSFMTKIYIQFAFINMYARAIHTQDCNPLPPPPPPTLLNQFSDEGNLMYSY
jgi:hypothetical protein